MPAKLFGGSAQVISFLLIQIIAFYQKAVSPYLGFRCRYVPTCSEYTKQAIAARGVFAGTLIGLKRILRCAPWGGNGLDLYEEKP